MVSLNFNVVGQHLTKVSEDFLANDSMRLLIIKAEFDATWNGFTKYGIFTDGKDNYRSIPSLVSGLYEFIVPSEVLTGKGFYFTFVGYDSDENDLISRITTNRVYVSLNESGFADKLVNGSFEEVDEEAVESLFSVFYTKAEVDNAFNDYYTKTETNTALEGKISKSETSGLVKNDGTIDTSTYLTTSSASSTYVPKSDGANVMKDSSAYTNIGTSANATQKTINNAINTKIGQILAMIGECEDLIGGE